jgi:hypothetical protein
MTQCFRRKTTNHVSPRVTVFVGLFPRTVLAREFGSGSWIARYLRTLCMQRVKEHRRVLKGLVKDIRLTPSRALLTEYILMVIDSLDEMTRRDCEIGALAHAGGPKLVEIFLTQIEAQSNAPVKPMLRNYPNTKRDSHQSTQNRLQRDTRSHPNGRLALELAAMSNDSTTLHERLFYVTLFRGGCVDARDHVKLAGLDEEPISEPHHTNADKSVLDKVTQFITSIKGGSSNGTSTDKG